MSILIKNLKIVMILLQALLSLGLSVEPVSIDGYNQKIYTIEASINNSMKISQKLAFNQMFGVETLSDMYDKNVNDIKKDGIIAVNGMFYNSYGRPYGIIIQNNELVNATNYFTPIIRVDNYNDVEIIEPETNVNMILDNKKINIKFNEDASPYYTYVYTDKYSKIDRLYEEHTVITVKNNKVVKIQESDTPVKILENSSVNNGDFNIVYVKNVDELKFEIGDNVEIEVEANFDYKTTKEAFQTGGYLIKDGKNVAKGYESFMGSTLSLQPRIAIGINKNKNIVIVAVDGRSKESVGLSGNMLANYMITKNVITAVYLDGGSSLTILENGKLFNNPSTEKEKKISHALFFDRKIDYIKD